jgi:Na+:H+ antiporter, NhaA family
MAAFQLTRSFKNFFESERAGGLILLACTILSLIIANSNWGDSYLHFWHKKLDASFGFIRLNYSIEEWINDGLMAIFFLLVGLEIERELYAGELKDIKNAVLPVAAAIGGMLVPALIHFILNNGTNTAKGFGIPMATDIAFALGMLSLMGNRVPASVKIFLTALAIIDDLGAILIIAIFYNTGISWFYLTMSLSIFGGLLILNRMKVYNLAFYLIPGIAMWYCMLQSGVHATITGVLLAFAIPFSAKDALEDRRGPSFQLQHFLHKPVAFLILPVFALANTGIPLAQGWYQQLVSHNSLGIILGLFLGKTIGILFFSWLLIKSRKGQLPDASNWKHLTGAAVLAGIGFTMSIFIANLAFNDQTLIQDSKVAILLGSAISCIVGLIWIRTTCPQHN